MSKPQPEELLKEHGEHPQSCLGCGGSGFGVYIWGMPSPEEMEFDHPSIRFVGCLIGPDTPRWFCLNCGKDSV